MNKILIICGEEGVGKSTITKAILPHLNNGASFDAETILQVNPFEYNDDFQQLAIKASSKLVDTYFDAGYENIVGASFLNEYEWLEKFKDCLSNDCEISILMLKTKKMKRDERREKREKKQTKEEMDYIDKHFQITSSLKDNAEAENYNYNELDNTGISIDGTISEIKQMFPDFFQN